MNNYELYLTCMHSQFSLNFFKKLTQISPNFNNFFFWYVLTNFTSENEIMANVSYKNPEFKR